MAKYSDKSPTFNVYGLILLNKISNTFFLRCTVSKTAQNTNHFESFCHTFTKRLKNNCLCTRSIAVIIGSCIF